MSIANFDVLLVILLLSSLPAHLLLGYQTTGDLDLVVGGLRYYVIPQDLQTLLAKVKRKVVHTTTGAVTDVLYAAALLGLKAL